MMSYRPGDTLPSGWRIAEYLDSGVNHDVYAIYQPHAPDELWSLRVSQVPKAFAQVARIFEQPDRSAYLDLMLEHRLLQYDLMEELSHIPYVPSPVVVDIQPQRSGVGWHVHARMPLLVDLREHFSFFPPTAQDVVTLGVQLTHAIEGLHNLGYLHRDVSLNNIMWHPEGRFQLIDYGNHISLEDALEGYASKTSPTPPEGVRGEPFGVTADVYALGLSLYRLLNGNHFPLWNPQAAADTQSVFASAEHPLDTFCRVRFTKPWPDPTYGSSQLKAVIQKACHMDAHQRYPTMEALREELFVCDHEDGTTQLF